MTARTAKDVPVEHWPPGWLKMEVCRLTRRPEYADMSEHQKVEYGLPVTVEEMRTFIAEWRRK